GRAQAVQLRAVPLFAPHGVGIRYGIEAARVAPNALPLCVEELQGDVLIGVLEPILNDRAAGRVGRHGMDRRILRRELLSGAGAGAAAATAATSTKGRAVL